MFPPMAGSICLNIFSRKKIRAIAKAGSSTQRKMGAAPYFCYCVPMALDIFLSFRNPFSISSDAINTNGKIHPANIPLCRLFPAFCVILPTRLGPNAPPKSPAMASRAKHCSEG